MNPQQPQGILMSVAMQGGGGIVEGLEDFGGSHYFQLVSV